MRKIAAVVLLLCAGAACGGSGADADEQARREAEFETSMQDVVLEGHFTVSGRGEETKLRPERYEIKKVSRLAGNLWTITTRIQYGEHDVTVPVPVRIGWAEDTPVIMLTDAAVPGLGTFSARVVFYGDHYSGMWSHGEAGGNQFGRIIRAAP